MEESNKQSVQNILDIDFRKVGYWKLTINHELQLVKEIESSFDINNSLYAFVIDGENDDLVKKQVVIDRYQREIDKYNEELGQVEKVKVFRLVSDEWSPENGIVSPTQKLKRKKVREKYIALLDERDEKNKN